MLGAVDDTVLDEEPNLNVGVFVLDEVDDIEELDLNKEEFGLANDDPELRNELEPKLVERPLDEDLAHTEKLSIEHNNIIT